MSIVYSEDSLMMSIAEGNIVRMILEAFLIVEQIQGLPLVPDAIRRAGDGVLGRGSLRRCRRSWMGYISLPCARGHRPHMLWHKQSIFSYQNYAHVLLIQWITICHH